MEKLPALNNYAKRLKAFIDASAPRTAPSESFDTMASDLLALQRAFNPVYDRFCESLGIGSPRDWQDFAFLPATSFKDFEVTMLAKEERTTVFRSSGTTQANRSAHFHNAASLELYKHSLLAWFRPHMLNGSVKDLRILSLSPHPQDVPESSLVHMFETVSLELPENSRLGYFAELESNGGWKLNLHALQKTLNELSERDEPALLLGTAFSFVHMLDGIEPVRMPPGSRVMETGGYKGRSRVISKADLHRSISALLAIPPDSIVTEYGMSELSSQAYDRICGEGSSPSHLFRFPPWARARIISPETGNAVEDGEAGLLQVLDLANAYSAAAIQTEDVAIKTGDSFQLLGRSESALPRGCSLMPTA